jgi:hypothetical protein
MANQISDITPVLKAHREALFDRTNVAATGVGYKETAGRKTDTLSIVCSVTEKLT